MRAHWPILIFLAPFLAAIATPMLGLRYRGACRPLALLALSAMSLASLLAYREVLTGGEIRYALSGWDPPFGIEWVLDGLSGIMAVILSLLSLIAMVYAGPTTPKDMGGRIVPWYTLILLMVSALAGIVFAADLFNLFVFLEVAALCSYALIGVAGGRALMAAFRYLIVGTIGGFLFLLGIAYFYAATGTLNMADLAQQLPALLGSKAVLAGLIFIFIGLAIKMALVPFHGWVPDAYADAPDAISPLLASLVTKMTLYAVIRITFWVLGAGVVIDQTPLLDLLLWAGVLTTLVGAFLALSQQDIKRMFAYSGISHIGLIVIGVSLGNATGFAGGMFALIAEAVMLALLFFVSGALFYRGGARNIDDLVRLRGQMPWTVTAFIVTALSMVGIPPTGGFFGKWYILLGALEAQKYVVVVAIIGSSLLTLAYFLKIIRTLVFEESPPSNPRRIEEAPFAIRISMAVLTATIIGLGIGSDWVMAALLASVIPAGL